MGAAAREADLGGRLDLHGREEARTGLIYDYVHIYIYREREIYIYIYISIEYRIMYIEREMYERALAGLLREGEVEGQLRLRQAGREAVVDHRVLSAPA